MSSIRFRIATVLAVFVITAVLGFVSIPRITEASNAVLYFESSIVSLMCIVVGCMIYSDRNDWKRELFDPGSVSTSDGFIRSYRSYRRRSVLFIAAMAAIALILAGVSVTLGQKLVTFTQVYQLIWDHLWGVTYDRTDPLFLADILVWDVNIPRAVATVVTGCSLAIGGAAMQSVIKNPLADPYTTGISSGAVLGVSVCMVLGITVQAVGGYGLVFNAFLFSLIPAFLMIFISRISHGSVVTIILVGTAISYIFSSVTTILMLLADETTMDSIFVWEVGSLNGMTWSNVPIMFVFTAVCSVFLYLMSNKLNLLMMGDNDAKALGLNINNFRTICLVAIALMTASVICFTGIIGFLGLLCPHIVRMVVGSDSRLVIPSAAALGSVILFLADIVSRTAATKAMPVGVVMSFIGGPLFLLLVLRMRREVIG